MNNELLIKFHSAYNSYKSASSALSNLAEDFIKDCLEQSDGKKIDFNWGEKGERVEIRNADGFVYNPAMAYLDEDGDVIISLAEYDVIISLAEYYEVMAGDIDSYYLAEIAFAVKAHLLNNQK
jgi:hypothetical protein